MISEITNPLLINRILELARIVPDTPIDKLKKMLIEGLTSKQAKIFIDEKNGEVRGFIFATVEQMEGEDCVFIQFCVIKPIKEERYIGFELLLKIRLWVKDLGLKYIYTMTPRSSKPFIRKYGFKFYTNVLRLRVNKEVVNEPDKKNISMAVPV